MKRDHSVYSDVIEDITWDGVWHGAARVDSAGWVAEFAVPFSQLRYNDRDSHESGFGVWRDIARLNQRDAWPEYRPSARTLMAQLGTVTGIERIAPSGCPHVSAFEIRFDERRPFFQEGASLYRCGGPREGVFYTRRIGRTPQLRASPPIRHSRASPAPRNSPVASRMASHSASLRRSPSA